MILTVFNLDASREECMHVYIQDMAENSAKVIVSRIENWEKVTTSKIDHLNDKLDSYLDSKKK